MFAIYTPEGRAFLGPLEQLRRVEKVEETRAIRAITDPDVDGRDLLEEQAAGYTVSQKAAQQYRSLLQREEKREPVYHAYQIMSHRIQLLQAEWTLSEAMSQFNQYPYHVFPVLNKNRQLVSVLSRRELYEFLLREDTNSASKYQTIAECFISRDTRVYSADPVTDVRRITTLLIEKNLDALPIVEEGGRVVGIVSRTDILRCAISDPPLSLWC